MKTRIITNLLLGLFLTVHGFCSLPFWNYSDYAAAMQRVLDLHGISSQNHSVLLNNGIYYMQNYLTIDEAKSLPSMEQNMMVSLLGRRNFWAEKLSRDLQIPYSDQEFHIHMKQVQRDLNEFLEYMKSAAESGSYSLYLYGSMAKGRFGANSSADIYVQTQNQALLDQLEGSKFSKDNPSGSTVEILTSSFGEKYLLAPMLRVSSADLANIQKTYARVLSDLGFYFSGKGASRHLTRRKGAARYHLEFNPIEDRVYFLVTRARQLEQTKEARTANKENAYKFERKALDLIGDFKEVQEDLDLIINQVKSARHNRIKEVISPESYARLRNHRSRRLKKSIKKWSGRVNTWRVSN